MLSFENFSNSRQLGKNRLFTSVPTLAAAIVILKNVQLNRNTAMLALVYTILRIFAHTDARKIFQPAIFKYIA